MFSNLFSYFDFGFFAGFCFSLITPSINKAIQGEVLKENRSISMGIAHSGNGIGGFLGAILLPIIAAVLGWRISVFIAGTVAVLLGLVVVKNYKPLVKNVDNKADNNQENKNLKADIKNVFLNKQLLLVCFFGFVFGLGAGIVPAHFTLFVTTDLYYSSVIAGIALGISQVGGILGQIFWAWLSNFLFSGNHKKTLIFIIIMIAILSLVYGLLGSLLASSIVFLLLTSFFLGVAAMGWGGIFFTEISERAFIGQIGIASGMATIFIRSGIVIGPPLFGMLADYMDNYFYSWFFLSILILIFAIIIYSNFAVNFILDFLVSHMLNER
ncbi:MFS transporter [Natronospora cellulosivora (SeqCode)]